MSIWLKTTIGDQATLQRGIDITKDEQRPGKVPVISSGGVSSFHDTVAVKGPGVVLGRKGVVGSVYYIDEDYWPHDTSLWVKDFHGNHPRFVYYFFKSVAPQIARMDVGSANPTLNRNHVHPMPVDWPPLAEQKAIAAVLGALDDKIENNRKLNHHLEQMARALFQSWFVDFDPVRTKLDGRQPVGMNAATAALFPAHFDHDETMPRPNGWLPKSVHDSATFINGVAFKNVQFSADGSGLPVVKIAELKDGISKQTKFTNDKLASKYRIRDGEILFSWSGSPDTSIDTFLWSGGDGWLNQHIFKVEFHHPEEKLFVYYLLKHLKPTFIEIARNKQTTGLGHVTAQDMKRLKVVFPPQPVLQAFQAVVQPIFECTFATQTESRTLATLRDTLLPKLLSGELSVADVAGK